MERIKRIQNGEKELLNDFIKDNMEYILSFTEKYKYTFEDYEDLVNEAIIGFIKSIYKYNYEIEFKLYSYRWVSTHVKRYLLKNLDRISDIEDKFDICIEIYESTRNSLKQEPTIYDIARSHGLKLNTAYEILNTLEYCDKYTNEIDIYDIETIDEESLKESTILKRYNSRLFAEKKLKPNLTKKQYEVIKMRYGFEDGKILKLKEIADMNNVTHQSVVDLEKHAKEKIRAKKLLKEI